GIGDRIELAARAEVLHLRVAGRETLEHVREDLVLRVARIFVRRVRALLTARVAVAAALVLRAGDLVSPSGEAAVRITARGGEHGCGQDFHSERKDGSLHRRLSSATIAPTEMIPRGGKDPRWRHVGLFVTSEFLGGSLEVITTHGRTRDPLRSNRSLLSD